jgi:hypothetical protein
MAAGRHDLYLTVVDLNDGSLQNLWARALPPEALALGPNALLGKDAEKRLAAWEAALLESLPYLPVLENLHWAVSQESAPIRAICPACIVPVSPPGRGGQSGGPGAEYVPPEG